MDIQLIVSEVSKTPGVLDEFEKMYNELENIKEIQSTSDISTLYKLSQTGVDRSLNALRSSGVNVKLIEAQARIAKSFVSETEELDFI